MSIFMRVFAVTWDRQASEGMGTAGPSASRTEQFFATSTGAVNQPPPMQEGTAGAMNYILPWPGGNHSFSGGSGQANERLHGGGLGNQGGIHLSEVLEIATGYIHDVNADVKMPFTVSSSYAAALSISDPVGAVVGLSDTAPILQPDPQANPIGPFTTIDFGTAAAARMGNPVGATCQVVATVRDRFFNYGHGKFSEFVDTDTGDTKFNVPKTLEALNQKFINARKPFSLGFRSDGSEAIASDCNFAGPSPFPAIFIRASSIGSNNEQIPSSGANNTAAHFRFFPQAFFRHAKYVRRIEACTDMNYGRLLLDNSLPVDIVTAQPYFLMEVTRQPTHSRWGFIINGQWEEVILSHGAEDLRTGLEIWENLVVPLIQVSGDSNLIPTFDLMSDPPESGAFAIQTGVLRRLAYLQYAELLDVIDLDAGPNTTPFNQFPG